ncbi:MAG: hypothetical protein DWQ37_18215 [Planctomycetota bacterium]|nr:MAG: hypothetical protein DWQ37_18215 [Planctomycetota bacterium]
MRYWFAVLCAVSVACGTTLLSGCGRPVAASPNPQPQAANEIRETLLAGASEGGGSQAAASTGTGWGTLRGTFKFAGTPPTPGTLDVTRDTEVCSANGPIRDNSLLVGPDKGIANVVVYARVNRVHDSAKPLEPGADVEPLVFDQKDCMFTTHVMACQVNQPIDIKNSDPVGHNTKIDPRTGVPFNQTVGAGGSLGYKLVSEEALPAPVSCSIHPWMQAYMLPREDKYFAVTTSDGGFEIPNLPAGEEIELQVWHERGGGPGGAVVLPRKDLKWTRKGRFKVNLKQDETLDLGELEVPGSALK